MNETIEATRTDEVDVNGAQAVQAESVDATPAATPAPAAVMLNVAGANPELVLDRAGENLKIKLGEFAGPLDLLLYLIRQEQVSIYDISIARITDEYLHYLRLMQEMDITVAGEFVVMAATLIEIKSRMLLPRAASIESAEEAAEDPRNELIRQLLEHQKYKAAAQMLWSRVTVEQATFHRAPIETDKQNPEISAGVFDLLRVFQVILSRRKDEVLMEIERDELTMTDMLTRLRDMVRDGAEMHLTAFFERARSRRELVLAFLSVLELVRAAELTLIQTEVFGDIRARARVATEMAS